MPFAFLGAIVGAWLGGVFGGIGALIGAYLGAVGGGYIDRRLFGPGRTTIEGPRLESLKVQISSYGAPINWLWGAFRIAGNLIWAARIWEVRSTQRSGDVEYVSYAYYGTFAVGLCRGPIEAILKIWANGDVIYNITTANQGIVQMEGLDIRMYYGAETQLPDSLMELFEGEGMVPAYRGLVYVVFNNLPLEKFGNRIPNLNFLVVTKKEETLPWVEIENSGPFTSDNIIDVPYDHRFLVADGSIRKVLMKIDPISHRVTQSMANPNFPYAAQIDIDEQGFIYADYEVGALDRRWAKASYASLRMLSFGPEVLGRSSSMKSFHVSRNPRFPFLMIQRFSAGGRGTWYFHVNRTSLRWSATEDFGLVFVQIPPASSGELGFWAFTDCAIDHDNGVCGLISNNDNGLRSMLMLHDGRVGGASVVIYTSGIELTDRVIDAEYVCFDPETSQWIIAGHAPEQRSLSIVTFWSYTGTFLARLDTTTIGTESNFDQGVVDGFLWIEKPLSGIIYKIDVRNHVIDRTYETEISLHVLGGSVYDKLTHSMIVGWNANSSPHFSPEAFGQIFLDRGDPEPVPLWQIVQDICEDRGLTQSEIITDDLTDLVKGFVINNRTAARGALERLAEAYFFDGIESDGYLKFPKRGAASALTVPDEHLGTRLAGEEPPQRLISTRQQELELPRKIDVVYSDPDSDWDNGLQSEQRLITASEEVRTIEVPISLDKDEAKQIAVKHLALAWMQRTRHRFVLPRDYAYLDASDVITIIRETGTHVVRIDQITHRGGLLEIEASNEDSSVYESNAVGAPLPPGEQTVVWEGPCDYHVIDTGLTPISINEAGMLVAAQGYTDYWRGAEIRHSLDGGAWGPFAVTLKDAVMGYAANALPEPPDPWLWDDGSHLDVDLGDSNDTLDSFTESQIMAGTADLALVGDELIYWRDATELEGGRWRLTGLLRARFGTDWATSTHGLGDRFVLLRTALTEWAPMSVASLASTAYYLGISLGMPIASGLQRSLTVNFRCLKPLAPVHVAGSRDGSNNLTITWIRRTRINGDVWTSTNTDADPDEGYTVPLGEDSEAYEVDIMDSSSAAATVLRTIEVTAQTASFTAAQQISDGFTPGDPITCRVYQLSASIGRGFAREETV